VNTDPANLKAESSGSVHVARWAGALGVVLPAVGTAVYPIWSYPATQASDADVARWAVANHDRLVTTQVLNTGGVALWLIFGAAVWTYLRDRLPAGSTLATGFAAGLVGFVTLILSGFTAFDLLLYRNRGAETSALLYDLTFGLLAMSGIPTAVALGSFAVAVYVHRMLPRSTAHLAVIAAAGHLLLIAAFIAHEGPLSLEGVVITAGIPVLLFAWILRTALAMPRKTQVRSAVLTNAA
jgi:hypothetical protein